MSENTALLIYNICLMLVIVTLSIGGFYFLGTAQGLWSLMLILIMGGKSDT